jgi:IPT/TIG domain/Autotransporter beta-domain
MVSGLRLIRIAGLVAAALAALVAGAGAAYAQVTPSSGPAAGGTSITISGNGFANGDVVQIGGVAVLGACLGGTAATNVTVVDSQTITAKTPAGSPGAANVLVCTILGSVVSQPGTFTYLSVPTVSSVSPNSGPSTGGASVFIIGSAFTGATALTFGGNAATLFTVINDTTIQATTPAGTLGVTNVAVTTAGGTGTGVGVYTYVLPPPPTVTAISPNSGSTTGGTAVTITGTNLAGATAVTIGGTAASFTVLSATSINASTPPGTAGTASVLVTTPGGTNAANTLFTYVTPPPTVAAISPNNGPVAGGTFVTIIGTGFTGATAVTIGGSPATSVTVVSATTITATTSAGSAGPASVLVTTPNGTNPANTLYTYGTPPPTVTSVNPPNGSLAGGTPITITGAAFTGATSVTIGGSSVAFTFVNDTTITAVTPAHALGPVNVTVTTPIGTGTGIDLYTYTPPPPTVTAITPNSGPTAGGTAVTITGSNFTGAALVTIGGYAVTGVTVVNDTTITATTPTGSAGAANVAVTTPAGTGTGIGLFTYVAPTSPPPPVTPTPTVTAITPSSGPLAGGTSVSITGSNFTGATAVTFGGIAATSFSVNGSGTIVATTPAHAAGAVNVAVTTPGGTFTLANGFTYQAAPTVTSISPGSGPVAGGTLITITGTNFIGVTAVTFGGVAAAYTVVSATTITAITPAHAAGAVDVSVTTPGGTDPILFNYLGPVPADSVKLNSLEVSLTPVIAQASGAAISSAAADAISVGFSGNPQPLTPNGSGFTFYFDADPQAQGSVAPADDGVRSFAATPDQGTSRIDDAFSEFTDTGNSNRAPPQPITPRDWLGWIDVRGTSFNSYAAGNDMTGIQGNALVGLTHRFTPDFLVGMLGGYEYFDYTDEALSGRLTGGGWTAGAYLGWRLASSLRFDAAFARSGIDYNGTAGTAAGAFSGGRWLASGGLTGTYRWQGLVLQPSARVYGLWEHDSGYTDSLGTVQPDNDFSTGRASGGAKVAYTFEPTSRLSLAPYAGVYGDYYFTSSNAAVPGAAPAPIVLLQGWAARFTSGLDIRFSGGGELSFGGELGGVGSTNDTKIWTYQVRGSLPF